MIKQGRTCIISLTLFVGFLRVCDRPLAVSAQSPNRTNGFTGVIVRIEPKEPKGRLRIKQGPGLSFVDGAENMLVRRGHLLFVEANTRVTIRCGDGRDHDLIPGVPQGCPCTAPCLPEVCGLRYDGSTIRSTRHDNIDSFSPAIISPRAGFVLSTRPKIQWTPIAARDDVAYTVSLQTENKEVIWSRKVISKTELDYPDDTPPLTRGRIYSAVVSTEPAGSDAEAARDLTFTTLPAREVQTLSKKIRRLRQSRLPEGVKQILIANLYASKELYTEAIALLEGSKNVGGQATIRMLGDLYLAVGLDNEAEKRYLEALSLAPGNDLEDLALLQLGLAWVYQNLGAFDRAAMRLGEAISAYEKLGNTLIAERLAERMKVLTKVDKE